MVRILCICCRVCSRRLSALTQQRKKPWAWWSGFGKWSTAIQDQNLYLKAKIHSKNKSEYLAKEILKRSKLSHGHGHLTHVVCHISCWSRRRKRPSQGLCQGLLKGFHSLWKCILSLLRRLLEVAYPWQLLLSERFKLCWKQLQFVYFISNSMTNRQRPSAG